MKEDEQADRKEAGKMRIKEQQIAQTLDDQLVCISGKLVMVPSTSRGAEQQHAMIFHRTLAAAAVIKVTVAPYLAIYTFNSALFHIRQV
jgi:hypothetical protein